MGFFYSFFVEKNQSSSVAEQFKEMRLNDYNDCSAKLVSDYEINRFLSCDSGFSNDLFDDQSTTTFVRTTLY